MVKHIIIWTLKDSFSDSEKEEIKKNIKSGLEGLMGKIEGLTEIRVQTDRLPTSTGDLMLDSTFTSAEALKAYATHPAHVEVADRDVRPFTAQRSCLDFEI
ncbi:MAG: Dabb family protein [Ruminiclostridium sp.]|nr:Dabb family protein [Ruminiclostridium sp.]